MPSKKSPRPFLRSRILVEHMSRLATVVVALSTYFTMRRRRIQRVVR
jgi:hypothetical protein